MPKPHTFPTLYNDALQISIAKLNEWNYINPEQIRNGIVTWSRNGEKTASLSIMVNAVDQQPHIELEYDYKKEPRKYRVNLVCVPSNLGRGIIWYFLCPQTNKRCRKLYSVGGYFLHREAFNGCMYESQTQSKKYRQLDKTLGVYFRLEKLYERLYQKHFKKAYAGKPTKSYLRIMEQIQKAESIPYHEIERAMLI